MKKAHFVNTRPNHGTITMQEVPKALMGKDSKSFGGLVMSQHILNEYHYHFDQGVDDITMYRDLTMTLVTMQETDTLNLYINSPGGYVDTMFQLVNLITNCKGTVIGHLLGPSASAACSIFLSCHGWMVHPYATLMGHTWRGGIYGKGKMDVIPQLNAFSDTIDNMMIDLYFPFFTMEEIGEMIDNNRDIYLTHDEINKRIEILAQHRKEIAEKGVSTFQQEAK